MPRVLLFSTTTGYQLRAFNDAAETLGVELLFATDRCDHLEDPWQDAAIPVRFYEPDAAIAAIRDAAATRPVDGVIAVGDRPMVLAARAADALGLMWHSVEGATATTNKHRSRTGLTEAGLPSPRYAAVPVATATVNRRRPPAPVDFPCVLKPIGLSGSRGVIRANSEAEFAEAFQRIEALLARPQIRAARDGLDAEILVEEYIVGREYALDGVMTDGALTTFAIFDKPDPLVGPYFEETIYVTPPQLVSAAYVSISAHVERAARALGLVHGPIHAECRTTLEGRVYVLEVAGRPIGGLCSRVLRFQPGLVSLEEVLLGHAVGDPIDRFTRESDAAAVMMIPIPKRGLLKNVAGEATARQVPGVEEVRITAKRDQLLEPLPEAGSYLGFIFARATVAAAAERAVRAAHAALEFQIDDEIAVKAAGQA
jgi:biotin carboxylase